MVGHHAQREGGIGAALGIVGLPVVAGLNGPEVSADSVASVLHEGQGADGESSAVGGRLPALGHRGDFRFFQVGGHEGFSSQGRGLGALVSIGKGSDSRHGKAALGGAHIGPCLAKAAGHHEAAETVVLHVLPHLRPGAAHDGGAGRGHIHASVLSCYAYVLTT